MAANPQDSAPLFAEGGSGTLRLVTYIVMAVVLMVVDHRGQYLAAVRQAAANVTGPVYWLVSSPVRLVRGAHTVVTERGELAGENAELRQQLLLAQARLARLAAVQEQNARLRELLDARGRLALKAQLAELVDVDLDPFRHRVVLDVGSTDGVGTGQAVIDAHGVVGQLLEVQPHRSIAILITDAGHALPVRVVRTGLRAIAYGTGDVATLRLPHIPFSADIRVGDELVTSGLGGHFPAGLPVGVIRTLTPDDSATFVLALATPTAGMSRSGELLVLHDERETIAVPGQGEYEFVGPPEALPVTPAGGGGAQR
ncbi:MAG TPA: rod shape-determining protein MreC [Xanthomonadales bacterium]|nr:rod shape-determining protein MreC [Xanthomonadales bacterium]